MGPVATTLIRIWQGMRPTNLLLLGLALPSFRYFLMLPVLETRLLNFGLEDRDFWIMVAGSLLLAGAGNLVNDYYDAASDRLNNKGRTALEEREFWPVYLGINTVGLVLCAWSAWQAGLINLLLIPLAAVFFLFRYSEDWKSRGWLGPLVISGLCGLWITLPWFYEYKAMGILYRYYPSDSQALHLTWAVYLALVVAVTLARELVKACQDLSGDLQVRCRTVAVQWGSTKTLVAVRLIWILVLVLNLLALMVQWRAGAWPAALYTGVTLGWGLFVALLLSGSKAPSRLVTIGNALKGYLTLGILSLGVYYLLFLYGNN
jgi:4-hydroxybenzoate polyprenyltransferase